ncbi:DUF4236 domain-containing protein [Lachnospiraceae bacterium LCP25S3_G4]
MGLKFRKSIKIAPGVKLNLGKKSAGVSFGTKGCRYSLNSSGRRTSTVGLPGTGLSYSHTSTSRNKSSSNASRSYNYSAYSQRAMIQQQKQEQKLAELEANALDVEEYENYIDLIKNVHRECESMVDWISINTAPAPFEKELIGPSEKNALQEYNNFSPTFFEKLFKQNGAERKAKLGKEILEAKSKDEESYKSWEESVAFASEILNGNIDSYYEAIATSNPFEDLVEFGSGFEFGTDNPDIIEIEFSVKSNQVIPEEAKALTKTGKLSVKKLSKTIYYDITQDYVCSCAIRLARELFALLPINNVLVHATDQSLNSATGHYETHTILSVLFTRNEFQNINFNQIDASDFVETFKYNMIFKKTTGFHPIDRLIY